MVKMGSVTTENDLHMSPTPLDLCYRQPVTGHLRQRQCPGIAVRPVLARPDLTRHHRRQHHWPDHIHHLHHPGPGRLGQCIRQCKTDLPLYLSHRSHRPRGLHRHLVLLRYR